MGVIQRPFIAPATVHNVTFHPSACSQTPVTTATALLQYNVLSLHLQDTYTAITRKNGECVKRNSTTLLKLVMTQRVGLSTTSRECSSGSQISGHSRNNT